MLVGDAKLLELRKQYEAETMGNLTHCPKCKTGWLHEPGKLDLTQKTEDGKVLSK